MKLLKSYWQVIGAIFGRSKGMNKLVVSSLGCDVTPWPPADKPQVPQGAAGAGRRGQGAGGAGGDCLRSSGYSNSH